MTDLGIPSPYVRDERRPPPSRDELRARIPGWGVDLDPADRPSHPKLQYPAETGAHWEFPDRQPEKVPRERSIEHAMLTPVFGTAQPRKGLAGAIRTYAYGRFSEGRRRTGCCSSPPTGWTRSRRTSRRSRRRDRTTRSPSPG
jgi:hypothetical protein